MFDISIVFYSFMMVLVMLIKLRSLTVVIVSLFFNVQRRARFSFMGGKGGTLWKQVTFKLSDKRFE